MEKVEDISILNPAGELDTHEGRILLQQIANLIKFDWRKIVLDLREVDHIHFRFLSELGTAAHASSLQSGGIKLANLNPYTREILKMTGADKYLETYDSVAEAILSFHNPLTRACVMQ